ncbi:MULTISPECIES: type 1 glutamine amidotransferase [unclassified Yoonia]|uniref:type 1 glutamine amidotransferase n=1 Tax=unclassified Yoonia TaxID=2629118 RepID=UPI002AFEB4FA|nr:MULTISPECIES: type 1 glutamine amidotransferase [unclassified Yoonia]
MKIGILQTGHAPDELRPTTGDFADLFQRLLSGNGFDFIVYNVVDMEFPQAVSDCDGWLITGSKHGAYEDHPFIPPLEALIRDIYAADIPLVGVCFGHQITAQALGGKVEKFAGGWAVGRQEYDINGTAYALNAWHQDQVVTRPDDATVVGSNNFCTNAALVYGNRIFTVQPHPEFDTPVIDGLLKYRGPGNVPDAQLEQVRDDLDKPVDSPRLAAQIARFFKERTLA